MAEFPYFRFYAGDYLGDTSHLSCIEHGAYLLLLIAAWRTPTCDLPDDDKLLARYARLTAGQWRRIRPILEPFFSVENGRWESARLTEEREAVRQLCNRGVSGARAKWRKNKETGSAQASRKQCQSEPESEEEANASSPPVVPPSELDVAFDEWNAMAARAAVPACQARSDKRRKALRGRLRDAGGLDGWRAALAKVEASDFLRGLDGKWQASIDFLLSPSNFAKVMEGNYDNRAPPDSAAKQAEDRLRRHFERMKANEHGTQHGGEVVHFSDALGLRAPEERSGEPEHGRRLAVADP